MDIDKIKSVVSNMETIEKFLIGKRAKFIGDKVSVNISDLAKAIRADTDLVKALEGLRLHPLGSDRHVNEIAAHNEAIDRAIEIVRGLRGT